MQCNSAYLNITCLFQGEKKKGLRVTVTQLLLGKYCTIDEIKAIYCYSLTGQSAVQSSRVDSGVNILQQQKNKKTIYKLTQVYIPGTTNFFFENNQTRLIL